MNMKKMCVVGAISALCTLTTGFAELKVATAFLNKLFCVPTIGVADSDKGRAIEDTVA